MLTSAVRAAAHAIKTRSHLAWIYARQQILSAVSTPHSATESISPIYEQRQGCVRKCTP